MGFQMIHKQSDISSDLNQCENYFRTKQYILLLPENSSISLTRYEKILCISQLKFQNVSFTQTLMTLFCKSNGSSLKKTSTGDNSSHFINLTALPFT